MSRCDALKQRAWVGQVTNLVFTHIFSPSRSFVPEGRRILAGGETTGCNRKHLPSPGGATDRPWSVAPPGLGIDFFSGSGGYAALHHRLISAVPPAQRHV